jgi:hypothetical protein
MHIVLHCLVMFAVCSAVSACKRSTSSSVGSQLTGTAFYRRPSGDSVILRALPVYLLTPEEAGSRRVPATLSSDVPITKTLDMLIGLETPKLKLLWSMRGIDADGARSELGRAEDLLARMQPYFAQARLVTRTDADGKFAFRGVLPGKYHLFAALDTTSAKGFWYLDVAIAADAPLTLDLENSNMTVVCDATQSP